MFFNEQKIETKRLTGFVECDRDIEDLYKINFYNKVGGKTLCIIIGLAIYQEEKKVVCEIYNKRIADSIEALDGCLKKIFEIDPCYFVLDYIMSNKDSLSIDFDERFGFIKSSKRNFYVIDKTIFDNTAINRQNALEKALSKSEQSPISKNLDDVLFKSDFLKNFNL
jgi:hypothetical protein